ncbi:MAG: flagellar export chaperone FliS [Myxococcales bacterium]|nr:flagellar export chaperone FliS [Myxococcales bacterium]
MNGYSRAYASNKYEGMSPERLILALYDGALRFMDQAKEAMLEQSVAKKGEAISKAVAIVAELQSSLNPTAGELVENLEALYDFVLRELAQANLHSDVKHLGEARKIIAMLRDGWSSMLDTQNRSAPSPDAAPFEPRKALVKGYL